MQNKRKLRILGGIVALVSVPSVCQAATFTPAPCPNFRIYTTELDSTTEDWPKNFITTSKLNNRLNVHIPVFANRNVVSMSAHVASLDIEPTYDKLMFQDEAHGFQTHTGLNSNFDVAMSSPAAGLFKILFYSDTSVLSNSFYVSSLTPNCGGPLADVDRPVENYVTNIAVLMGTNDVIYLKPVIPQLPYAGYRHLNLTMWRETTNFDFDLYARCGARPTPTNYTVRAATSTPNEYLDLTEALCPNADWYFAIHSYSGAGTAKFMWNWTTTVPAMEAYAPSLSPTDIDTVVAMMSAGQRRLFAMTQGAIQLKRIDLYKTTPTTPTIPYIGFNPTCTRSAYEYGQIKMCPYSWGLAKVLAHEMGHALINVVDEYNTLSTPYRSWCGHTIMADRNTSTDLCVASGWDHYFDGQDAQPQFLPAPASGWETGLANGSLHGFSGGGNRTPDGHTFDNPTLHPMNYEFQVVVH